MNQIQNELDFAGMAVAMADMIPTHDRLPLVVANMQLRMNELEQQNVELKATVKSLCKLIGGDE